MAKSRAMIVTTSGDRSIRAIAKDLKKLGFAVRKVNGEIGSITGTAQARSIAKLRRVQGVSDVSPDVSINLGPPGSPETW